MRTLRRCSIFVGLALVLGSTSGQSFADATPRNRGATPSTKVVSGTPICTTAATADPNVDTDCEAKYQFDFGNIDLPVEETTIAISPLDQSNIVGAAKDKQLRITKQGKLAETELTRAHVTFDGGRTWSTYPVKYAGYWATTDPSIAFDAAGSVYLGVVGFPKVDGVRLNTDYLVSRSDDGGVTWTDPIVVAQGSGMLQDKGALTDNSRLAAWGDGNVIVTWLRYVLGNKGRIIRAPLMDAVTHDGGATWSSPTPISGTAPFCVGLQGGHACNQNENDAVAVSTAGDVIVEFTNTDQLASETFEEAGNLTRTTRLVVQVDAATGTRTAGPFVIGKSFDGIEEHDYPLNVFGQPTAQDSQILLGGQGNLAADPTDPGHFAAIWYDDRNAPHPVARDPYAAVTDFDVIVSHTTDGGVTWTDPIAIETPRDQFMAWGTYDPQGRLLIGYHDRSYDPDNHLFGFTLATERQPGSLTFTTQQITTELSDPTRRSPPFYSVRTLDPDFPYPPAFMGDYPAIATTPNGVVAYWTDLRERACIVDKCGHGQDAFFAAVP
jgi:hypothetical protein